jgi:hypothetical protein
VAVETNAATLATFISAGSAARSVVALARKGENENSQPFQLVVANVKPTPRFNLVKWREGPPSETEAIDNVRTRSLQERISYVITELEKCPSHTGISDFRTLLDAIHAAATDDLVQGPHRFRLPPNQTQHHDTSWLRGGWEMLALLQSVLEDLETYRELTTPDAQRAFLNSKIPLLQSLVWNTLPAYWGNIGQELSGHWIDLLSAEARQTREWLQLHMQPIDQNLSLGQQTLQIQVNNPTSVLARALRLQIDDTPGIAWRHQEAQQQFLEGGKHTVLRLELEANEAGHYRVTGNLHAEDLSGNLFSMPFVFQIHVAQLGHPYRVPDYQPYVKLWFPVNCSGEADIRQVLR